MERLVNADSQDMAKRILKQSHEDIVIDKIKTLRRQSSVPGKRTDGLYRITYHKK